MSSNRAAVTCVFVIGALLAPACAAQAFEGTLSLRTVSIPRDQLGKLTGAGQAKAPDIFSVPMDKVLALKEAPGVKVEESTVHIRGSRLRADTPMPDDPAAYVTVDVDQNVTRIVLPKEKRYIEWTSADADALAAEIHRMQEDMKARLATLPPEQRKHMEAMMKELPGMSGAKDAAPKIDLRPLGQPRAINGFQTTGYEVQWQDETTRGWVTRDLPELSKIYKTSQENMKKMLPTGATDPRSALGEQGLPVLVQTVGPERFRVEELVAVEKKPVPENLFDVPADFKKTSARDEMQRAPTHAPPPPPVPRQ
jgi:hypothetical protein